MSALNVEIGADVTGLRTNLAVAKAELKDTSKEVRDFASQMVGASDAAKAELLPQLEALTAREAALRAEINESTAALRTHAEATEHSSGAFVTLRETTEGLNARITETKELFTGIGELFFAGLGVEKFIEIGEKAGEFAETLERAKTETGLTTDALQALSYAADHESVSFDQLQRGIAKMGTASEQAVAGSKKQEAAFSALGITTSELIQHGDDAQYMLGRVARALDEYGDGLNKEAIVTEIFGGKLRDMGPVLHEVAEEGIAGLIDKNRELGAQFSGEFIEDAAKGEKALKDFHHELQAVEIELGGPVLQVLEKFGRFIELMSSGTAREASYLQELRQHATELQTTLDNIDKSKSDHGAVYNFLFGHDAAGVRTELESVRQQIAELEIGESRIEITHANKDKDYKPEAPNIGADEKAMSEQKRLKQEAYQQAISGYQAEAEKYATYSDERIAILNREMELAKQYWGEGSKQYEVVQKEINAADRAAHDQKQQLLVQDTQSQIQELNRQLQAGIAHDQRLLGLKDITARQATEAEIGLTKAIYAEELKRLDIELPGLDKGTVAWKKAMDDRARIAQQQALQIERIEDQAARETERDWNSIAQPIETSITGAFDGMIRGTKSFSGAMADVGMSVVESFANYGLKMVEDWASAELMKLVLGKTTQTTGAISTITSDAAVAAAGAYAATAAIPFIGPELAPAAAATAEAGVLAFLPQASAAGGYDIPAGVNPVVQAHAQEMILPRAQADVIRELAKRADANVGATNGGGTHYHAHITGNIGGSLSDIKSAVVAALQQAHREGAFA